MRPRDQRGQIRRHGLDWEFRYYEDRMVDGKVKRVRASIALAPYSEYPYKGTKADVERLRQKFHEKITSVLVSVNRENAVAGTQTLGEFIERSYFPRLDWRLSVPAGNELPPQ